MEKHVNLEDVVKTHYAALWRYLRQLGCDAATADDLAQETFHAALRKPPANLGERAVWVYLRNGARFLYLKRLRRGRLEAAHQEALAAQEVFEEHGANEAHDRRVEALEECLGGTTERARRALALHYREERSVREIGRELGMHVVAVKVLLHRSRALLRECVERKLGS